MIQITIPLERIKSIVIFLPETVWEHVRVVEANMLTELTQ